MPTKIEWCVCGGEPGPGARPVHPDWVRSVRDQCQVAGVPFWFESWGEWAPWGGNSCDFMHRFNCDEMDRKFKAVAMPPYLMYRVGKKAAGRLLDGRTWEEMPK